MPELKLEIPSPVLALAEYWAPRLVPTRQYSGFSGSRFRGYGDLMDLVGSLMLFDYLSGQDVACNVDITAGRGDEKDLAVWLRKERTAWNVKTSSYRPFRSGLRMMMLEREVGKDQYGFIQAFVHLDEPGELPHLHVAGFTTKQTATWRRHSRNIVELPNANGARGVMIPNEELLPIEKLVQHADKKI